MLYTNAPLRREYFVSRVPCSVSSIPLRFPSCANK